MLMGEHAVLHNKLALVGAVNQRLHVTLTPRDHGGVEIYSALGEYHASRDALVASPRFSFVLATIKHGLTPDLRQGFRLDIVSDFASTVGLGSSAATVVATLACLRQWQQVPSVHTLDLHALFLDARAIIQAVQGSGSGADAAASVFGGIIAYRMRPFFLETSLHLPNIALIYTGYKTPTPEVIQKVQRGYCAHPEKYKKIFSTMDQESAAAWGAVLKKDWHTLGALMRQQQPAQYQLGVCDDAITTPLLTALNQDPTVLGCKISGAGLGDCVIALIAPEFEWQHPELPVIKVQFSSAGVWLS